MQLGKVLSLIVCLFLALVGSRPVDAAIIEVRYTGTVESGIDVAGFFTSPGSSLAGMSFATLYRFDTELGVRTTLPPHLDSVIGGPFSGTSNPSLGAVLKINGITFAFNGRNLGLQSNFNLGNAISSYATDFPDAGQFNASFIGNSLAATGIPVPMETPFASIGLKADSGFTNSFQIAVGEAGSMSRYAAGVLSPTHVQVTLSSAVPEPASWMLLVIGFFVLGSATRRSIAGSTKKSMTAHSM